MGALRLPVLAVVFCVFVVFSCVVVYDQGLFGFLSLAGREPWGLQILIDLGIALFFFASWMKRDARERGLPFAPYALLVLTLGSIGALAYLLHREVAARRSPVTR